ncbi:MAG: Bug family tripartite tricarboxylate transporter substrate binding protein, partial [Betaproteobacteria bacterium]
AGGSVDATARLIAPKLGERLGQQVIVENVAGAGGVIGTQKVADAPPNGYTLSWNVESAIIIARLITPGTVRYDGLKDFAPITMVGTQPLILVGKQTLPATSATELMEMLRANPGKYSYASSGIGTSLHLAGELIRQMGKVDMVHVPYKAGSQMVTDLAGNQVDMAVLPLVLAIGNVRAGKFKAFGMTDTARWPLASEIPALGEHPALKGLKVHVWYGLFAPAKTEPAIVSRLYTEMAAVVRDADTQKRLTDQFLQPVASTPAQFAAFLRAEQGKFAAIVKTANIKLD